MRVLPCSMAVGVFSLAALCAPHAQAGDGAGPPPPADPDASFDLWSAPPQLSGSEDPLAGLNVDPRREVTTFISRDGAMRLYLKVGHQRNPLWFPGLAWRDRLTIEGQGWSVGGDYRLQGGGDLRAEYKEEPPKDLGPDGFAVTLSYVRKF